MIKILSRLNSLKAFRLSCIPIASLFSTSEISHKITYPYVFGGLKDAEFKQRINTQLVLSNFYREDVI